MENDFYGVIQGINSLWTDGMLLDYTIEVEDCEFKVHKLMLAATSDYFRAMLTGGMRESQTDRVRLEGVSALAVSIMIQLIYTGKFGADKADVEELLACAMYLQIPLAIKKCQKLAFDEINPQNCVRLLSMLQDYSAEDSVIKNIEYITSHFEEVYKAWRPEKMTLTDITNLVDLWQKSEWDLFLAIKHWVDVDIENRIQHLNGLMIKVRFALMTPEQLDAITNIALYSGFAVAWCQNVEKALRYHNLPIHAKMLHGSEQYRPRDDPRPFYLNTHLSKYYELRKDASLTGGSMNHEETWQPCEVSETPTMRNGVEMFAVVNNHLVVCERYSTQQKWHIFDPRTRKWSSMAELQRHRWESALVHCNKHLYVIGGYTDWPFHCTDIIERYDFTTNSWSIILSRLPEPLAKHGAAVIDDCIYIAGGLMSGGYELSTKLNCLDTSKNTWHSKAELPEADYRFRKIQVMTIRGEEVLFIMSHHLDIEYYSPAQNQWFRWECNKSVRTGNCYLKWHSDATVLSDRKNALYLLNFIEIQIPCDEDSNGRSQGEESLHFKYAGRSVQCRKWTISPKEQKIDQSWLQQLPERCSEGNDCYRKFTELMLLAVPPKPSAPLSML